MFAEFFIISVSYNICFFMNWFRLVLFYGVVPGGKNLSSTVNILKCTYVYTVCCIFKEMKFT